MARQRRWRLETRRHTQFRVTYGVRSRRTHLLEDQLGRADAGSCWQIADLATTWRAELPVYALIVAIGNFRVRFVVEL